jgi:hypothetical protein
MHLNETASKLACQAAARPMDVAYLADALA